MPAREDTDQELINDLFMAQEPRPDGFCQPSIIGVERLKFVVSHSHSLLLTESSKAAYMSVGNGALVAQGRTTPQDVKGSSWVRFRPFSAILSISSRMRIQDADVGVERFPSMEKNRLVQEFETIGIECERATPGRPSIIDGSSSAARSWFPPLPA